MASDEFEQTLTTIDECFVFKIPPRASSEGHKASNWDLEKHIWSGRCRVTARGDRASIHLEDAASGKLFAVCHVPVDEKGTPAVEPVLDSSRYYVIQLVDERSGRRHFIGLGFNDRALSFDFKAALQDHKKYVKQMEDLKKNPPKYSSLDLSLKDGEVIGLNVAGVDAPAASAADLSAEPAALDFSLSGPPRRTGTVPEFAQKKKGPLKTSGPSPSSAGTVSWRAESAPQPRAAPQQQQQQQQPPQQQPQHSSGSSLLEMFSTPPAQPAGQSAPADAFAGFSDFSAPPPSSTAAPAASSDPFAGLMDLAKGGGARGGAAKPADDWGDFSSAPKPNSSGWGSFQ